MSRIDPVNGKTISERVGSAVVFAKFLERMPHTLLTITADGHAMFTNFTSGQMTLSFDTTGSLSADSDDQV